MLVCLLIFLTMIEVATAQCYPPTLSISEPATILSITGGQNLVGSGTFKYTLHDSTPVISVGAFINNNSCYGDKTDITYSLTGGPAGFVTGSVQSYTLDRSKALGPYPQTIALHL